MGSREPRLKVEPRFHRSDGDDAEYLASSYGLTLDPWQSDTLHIWFARDKYNNYAAGRCILIAPRQNGKNGVIEAAQLFDLLVLGVKVLHTAHRVKTAKKHFRRLLAYFKTYPELMDQVDTFREANGQEAIYMKNGGFIEFSSRSGASARGESYDKVYVDEAQFLTDGQLDAIMYAVSASENDPQIIYTGTPPDPAEGSRGIVLGRERNTALTNPENDYALHEWSVEGIGDVTDRSRWAQANPALGIRLKLKTVARESKSGSLDGFHRERLAWWPEHSEVSIIKKDAWDKLAIDADDVPDIDDCKICCAVKFSPDGATMSLAVAIKIGSKVHVELVDHRSCGGGIRWCANWLVERKDTAAQIVVDGLRRSGSLIEMLKEDGVGKRVIVTPTTGEVIKSTDMLLEAIKEKTLTHIAQPALDMSVLGAAERAIGSKGGMGFQPAHDEVCVTPIEAIALAHWSVKTTKRDPRRKLVVS